MENKKGVVSIVAAITVPLLIVFAVILVIIFGGLAVVLNILANSIFWIAGIVFLVLSGIRIFTSGFDRPAQVLLAVGGVLLLGSMFVPAMSNITGLSIIGG